MSIPINYIGNLPCSDTSDSDNSQENTTTQAQENPTTDNNVPLPSFICKLKQARGLKFAMEGLCDPVHNNNQGLGRIDVDEDGFNVTVENKDTDVVGHLFLKPSQFECTNPIDGMILNLPELNQKLTPFIDDDPLVIYHYHGFNTLFFSTPVVITETGPWATHHDFVELLENEAAIPKFPESLSSLFYARVPSNDLRLMIDHLLQQAPYQATVEIVENTATLEAVHENRVIGQYPLFVGVEPGERYRAGFEWSRAEWLNKARDETALSVGHTEQQPTYIVWRFFLGEGEYLEYVKEPIP